MKVALFFGSFNPIHIGHLIIANTIVENTDNDEVWFVVSPHNPFKKKKSLLHEFDRYDMVQAAIESNSKFRVSDIEFKMPQPSYTVDTLTYLSEKHPTYKFSIIVGGDSLSHFHKWKNYEKILEYGLKVYPRPNAAESKIKDHPKVEFVDAPLLDISATFIRNKIKEEKSVRYLIPKEVEDIIHSRKYYH